MARPCSRGLATLACTGTYMLLVLALLCVLCESKSKSPFVVQWAAGFDAVCVSNRFLQFTLSVKENDDQDFNFGLVHVASDFAGTGAFDGRPNLLSRSLLCMVHWRSDFLPVPCLPSSNITVSETAEVLTVSASFAAEDLSAKGRIVSHWTLELQSSSRQLIFRTEGNAHRIHGAYLALDVTPLSVTGRYASGSTQMMQQDGWVGYRPSADPLHHLFFVGPMGAVEIWRQPARRTLCGKSIEGDPTFLVSTPLNAGLRELIVGELHGKSVEHIETWGNFEYASHDMHSCKASFETIWHLSVNDEPFPPSSVPSSKLWTGQGPEYARVTAAATGIYATVLGTLATHNNSVARGKHLHAIATGVLHPRRGYAHLFNFFDPDSYLAIQALLLLGNDALNQEIRHVLELSGSNICRAGPNPTNENRVNGAGSEQSPAPRRTTEAESREQDPAPSRNCTLHQLPHHFVKDTPVYTAISGERQTGPNIFWTLTALEFGKTSGNQTWLQLWLPTFRTALAYIEMDPDCNLFWADGSLMIDTFVRRGFTSDTNAAMVLLLRELAIAEDLVGDPSRGAALRDQAMRVQTAMNERLWAGDHYITSVDARGETQDFVDYDSNLMAAAFGIADEAAVCAEPEAACASRAQLVLARVDSNPLARRVPGWVSEVLYQANWTQPPGGTADAVCGMGRIVWFEALARRRVRSDTARAAVERRLHRLQHDLSQMVWMSERYAPDGRIQADRTSHYFEFPAVTALLLHKVWYGIALVFDAITVDPWDVAAFDWFFGTLQVRYKRGIAFQVRVPRVGIVRVAVSAMAETEGVDYLVTIACEGDADPADARSFIASSDAKGALRFSAQLQTCAADLQSQRGASRETETAPDARYPTIAAVRLSAAADFTA